jgi:hypothetical protein
MTKNFEYLHSIFMECASGEPIIELFHPFMSLQEALVLSNQPIYQTYLSVHDHQGMSVHHSGRIYIRIVFCTHRIHHVYV